jgi:hypothetical protein
MWSGCSCSRARAGAAPGRGAKRALRAVRHRRRGLDQARRDHQAAPAPSHADLRRDGPAPAHDPHESGEGLPLGVPRRRRGQAVAGDQALHRRRDTLVRRLRRRRAGGGRHQVVPLGRGALLLALGRVPDEARRRLHRRAGARPAPRARLLPHRPRRARQPCRDRGNHGNRVSVASFDPKRVLAMVWPAAVPVPPPILPVLASTGAALSTNEA